jgi:tRNA(fMet)-specific endonuclease VapC
VKYLLDTDHISFIQRRSVREFAKLTERIAQHSPTDFALSVISFHEQVLGAHTFINRAQTKEEIVRGYNLLLQTLQGFSLAPVLPFDEEPMAIFDNLRAQGIRLSTMDLRIASIGLSRGLVLLTRNTRDFAKVPDLMIEDWTT